MGQSLGLKSFGWLTDFFSTGVEVLFSFFFGKVMSKYC